MRCSIHTSGSDCCPTFLIGRRNDDFITGLLLEEEYQAWNLKYNMIFDENSEVLFSELSPNGNG